MVHCLSDGLTKAIAVMGIGSLWYCILLYAWVDCMLNLFDKYCIANDLMHIRKCITWSFLWFSLIPFKKQVPNLRPSKNKSMFTCIQLMKSQVKFNYYAEMEMCSLPQNVCINIQGVSLKVVLESIWHPYLSERERHREGGKKVAWRKWEKSIFVRCWVWPKVQNRIKLVSLIILSGLSPL